MLFLNNFTRVYPRRSVFKTLLLKKGNWKDLNILKYTPTTRFNAFPLVSICFHSFFIRLHSFTYSFALVSLLVCTRLYSLPVVSHPFRGLVSTHFLKDTLKVSLWLRYQLELFMHWMNVLSLKKVKKKKVKVKKAKMKQVMQNNKILFQVFSYSSISMLLLSYLWGQFVFV